VAIAEASMARWLALLNRIGAGTRCDRARATSRPATMARMSPVLPDASAA